VGPEANNKPRLSIDEPVDDDFPADQALVTLSPSEAPRRLNAAHHVGRRDARGNLAQEHSICADVSDESQRTDLVHRKYG